MRIFTKKAAVAGSLIMALGLTGCFQDVPSDQDRKPATSAPTKSAKGEMPDTPKYEETKELDGTVVEGEEMTANDLADINENNKEFADKVRSEVEAKPFGIDTEVLVNDWSTPEVKEVFKEFNTAEGARHGLDFFQKVLSVSNYSQKRDASKDYEPLQGFEQMMTPEMQEKVKANIAEKGKTTLVPSADSNGVVTLLKDTPFTLLSHPTYKVWSHNVAVEGPNLRLDGTMEMTFLTDKGIMNIKAGWGMYVIPAGEDEWRVDGLSWRLTGEA